MDLGGNPHLVGVVVEAKAIGFSDYEAKLLLKVVSVWGWGCVGVPI